MTHSLSERDVPALYETYQLLPIARSIAPLVLSQPEVFGQIFLIPHKFFGDLSKPF